MPLSYPTAVAHAFLAFSSSWALYNTTNNCYAAFGFGLYLINGVLGILTYGLPNCSLRLYRFYSQVLLWALSLGLPLFVSQLYINTGFSDSVALVHLIFPLGFIFSGRHLKRVDNGRIFESFLMIYLSFMLYICLTNGNYYGVSTAVSFAIAFYVIGPMGTVKNTPSIDIFNYALSFSVYFLVQTLNWN